MESEESMNEHLNRLQIECSEICPLLRIESHSNGYRLYREDEKYPIKVEHFEGMMNYLNGYDAGKSWMAKNS
jgi:hypothetical protein